MTEATTTDLIVLLLLFFGASILFVFAIVIGITLIGSSIYNILIRSNKNKKTIKI